MHGSDSAELKGHAFFITTYYKRAGKIFFLEEQQICYAVIFFVLGVRAANLIQIEGTGFSVFV